jgi:hypothetical protein
MCALTSSPELQVLSTRTEDEGAMLIPTSTGRMVYVSRGVIQLRLAGSSRESRAHESSLIVDDVSTKMAP